ELQELADVFNQVGPRLKQHQQTQHSLALAGAIQKNLLPKQPPKMSNFDVAGRCLYCDDTGGDYYDFVTFNDLNLLRIGLILGDVTGHGIGAALLMASARSIMRNLSADPNNDLPSIMRQFNDQLADDTHDDKFMTLFYGVLNDDDRSLVWSSGGHEPAIWFHKTENKFEELSNTGPLMGFMKEMEFPQASPVFLKSGDIVLIGTDGIWESQDTDEQFYGKQRLYDIIQKAADQPARGIVDAVIESVELFTAPIAPKDDVTMIVIRAL
ncbi:MAG: serine/threonine-protein phosphatase, partial [Anaerohalosphaera sp.]|nr:serine/threonine-protein phosphatase [Anaerohalosphaera sp.]